MVVNAGEILRTGYYVAWTTVHHRPEQSHVSQVSINQLVTLLTLLFIFVFDYK